MTDVGRNAAADGIRSGGSRGSLLLGLAAALAILSVAAGCQSTRFRASTLPVELSARSMSARTPIDLASLSNGASFSDRVYPGDTLAITLATGIEDRPPTPWRVRVTPQGVANVPELGPIPLAGMRLADAERAIYDVSIQRKLYRNPVVTVTLDQRQTHHITVSGAVRKPASFDIPAPACDLSTALVQAGGLADDHGGVVVIKQPRSAVGSMLASSSSVSATSFSPPRPTGLDSGYDIRRVDLSDLHPGSAVDLRLPDGAVVDVVRQEPRTVQVLGLVAKPGRYEVPPDEEARLLSAIALAGGVTLQMADKVHIIRQTELQAEPVVIQASISKAKQGGEDNLLLNPGDVVSVEETPLTFTVGMLQSFIRVGFSAALPGL